MFYNKQGFFLNESRKNKKWIIELSNNWELIYIILLFCIYRQNIIFEMIKPLF